MRVSVLVLGLFGSSASVASAGPINLICQGTAEVDASTTSYGSRIGLVTTNGTASLDDSVGVRINDDNTGEMRLPRRMLPPVRTRNNNGWFPMIAVAQAPDEITGQVRLNQYNKPRVRLDRITGAIRVDGPLGDFSGRCQPFDPATVQRKF